MGHEDQASAWMQRAVALGDASRLACLDDPWVGCVVVAGNTIVGEGAHHEHGGPHAEPLALGAAGDEARGATAYVTLEPCDHHGRQPPCTDALIASGVQRVVVALEDPDRRVAGRGVARLREAGISVDVGLGSAAAAASLRPYLHHRATGRPWVVAKSAASLDGRTAAADRTSQWITGPQARADGHRHRALSQAIVVGAGTARTDLPALTVRDADPPPRAPLRVLLDSRGSVPAAGALFDTTLAPTLVVTTSVADADAVAAWKAAGAEVEEVAPGAAGGVDLAAVLALLGRRGVIQVLVEGGPSLHGALAEADLIDELILYVGGRALGSEGAPVFAGMSVGTLDEAPVWELEDVARLGGDARLTWTRPAARREGG